jgi:hypothetical protein
LAAALLGPLIGPGSRFLELLLGAGGHAVLSGRWRDFALGHRLRAGDHLVFRFKLGALEASVRIFNAAGVRRTYPQPAAQ